MARPVRLTHTRQEAADILNAIAAKGPFRNKMGLITTLSKTSINKILNNKAKTQSFNEEAHILAAVNVDRLFFNAIEPWKFELDPRKENIQLNNRMFFYSPMEFEGNIIPVKFLLEMYLRNVYTL